MRRGSTGEIGGPPQLLLAQRSSIAHASGVQLDQSWSETPAVPMMLSVRHESSSPSLTPVVHAQSLAPLLRPLERARRMGITCVPSSGAELCMTSHSGVEGCVKELDAQLRQARTD